MFYRRTIITIVLSVFLVQCTREMSECNGPEVNFAELSSAKKSAFTNGARAVLVIPNPIDATRNPQVMANDSTLNQSTSNFALPGLSSTNLLENGFLKVRIKSTDDSSSILATADSNGQFQFSVTDVHYFETMAYYSVSALMRYYEALGFKFVRSRPLYVLAQADSPSGNSSEVNAYYEHNYLNPSLPRIMRMIGKSSFAPGQDRDMYWHELGHFANESISGERGIDSAGDHGATYTEGAALHECLADYIAESVGDKSFIGKWINRNFEPSSPGKPLRSAVDSSGNGLNYKDVNRFNQEVPERYQVAEWCTRVLWQLRTQFVKEDPQRGAALSDRVVLSALSQLEQDTSMLSFYEAIQSADSELHCGIHRRSIRKAFEDRGFQAEPDSLEDPLGLDVTAVKANDGEVYFRVRVSNPNDDIAKNVRIRLESFGSGFRVIQYQQGLGDLLGGATVTFSESNIPLEYGIWGKWEASSGSKVTFKVSAIAENGETTVKEGEVPK